MSATAVATIEAIARRLAREGIHVLVIQRVLRSEGVPFLRACAVARSAVQCVQRRLT